MRSGPPRAARGHARGAGPPRRRRGGARAMEGVLSLLAVLALVLANGFFVASELALVSLRRSRVDQLVAEGYPLAPAVREAQQHITVYIAATQLGITMASLGVGWVGEP